MRNAFERARLIAHRVAMQHLVVHPPDRKTEWLIVRPRRLWRWAMRGTATRFYRRDADNAGWQQVTFEDFKDAADESKG